MDGVTEASDEDDDTTVNGTTVGGDQSSKANKILAYNINMQEKLRNKR